MADNLVFHVDPDAQSAIFSTDGLDLSRAGHGNDHVERRVVRGRAVAFDCTVNQDLGAVEICVDRDPRLAECGDDLLGR